MAEHVIQKICLDGVYRYLVSTIPLIDQGS